MTSESNEDADHGALLLREKRANEAFEAARRELQVLADRLAEGLGGSGIALVVAANGDLCATGKKGSREEGKTVTMPTTTRLKELVQQRDSARREVQQIKVALRRFQ